MWNIIFQITFFVIVSSFTSVGAGDTVSACVPDTYNTDTPGICRDVFYYLSQTDHTNCNQVCRVHDMSCTAVNHGFNDTTVLKIFQTVLGHTCLKKNHAYTAIGPAYYNQTGGKSYCIRWKKIPAKINCKRSPSYKRRLRLCPCVEKSSANSNRTHFFIRLTETDHSPKPTATDHSPRPTATDQFPRPTATDQFPSSTATDQFPRPTATDQSPRATATDQSPGSTAINQSPRPIAMYNDTIKGPGSSAACGQSKKDFHCIFPLLFLAFFQFF